MATEATVVEIDRERVKELTEREEARLDERTGASRAMYERARKTLRGRRLLVPGARPLADLPRRRRGANVWDVDGNELLDFHNGFGSMVQGHAHPAIGKAIAERYPHGHALRRAHRGRRRRRGELKRRWGLPRWRYTNSAPRRPWTRSGSRARPRGATRSSRSSAPTTATTTT